MRYHANRVIWTAVILAVAGNTIFQTARAQSPQNRFLDAIGRYADNVLEHGMDVYGQKHTPLFVDGLNIDTRKPVKWIYGGRDYRHAGNLQKAGDTWILSNLASHQNLLRTLVALSRATGNPKYRRAAEETVRYAFENLTSPNGLLHWGGHVAYDAKSERIVMEGYRHELKRHYPYYELMWEIAPKATRRFLESFWAAHILDWSKLDMNRHGDFTKEFDDHWNQGYAGGEIFFVGDGLTFCNTGSDLFYAGVVLHKLTGEQGPLVWATRMARRYDETRNPRTGLAGYQYSQVAADRRVQAQFGREFGPMALEGTLIECRRARIRYAIMGICQLKIAQMLGAAGDPFREWALEDLTAYGKHAYRAGDNTFVSLFSDGRVVTPEHVKRDGYYGPPESFAPMKADPLFFWAYAMAFRVAGDPFHQRMARDVGKGYGLGELGAGPAEKPVFHFETSNSSPPILLGLLEFYRKTQDAAFLELAQRVGDNILSQRFRKGFFVQSPKHRFAKFDTLEPLALLCLDAALTEKPAPDVWPGISFFHNQHQGAGRTKDNAVIYGLDSL